MRDYKVYFLSRDGHITQAEAFTAETDEDAMRIASQMFSPHGIELWHRATILKAFPPNKPQP